MPTITRIAVAASQQKTAAAFWSALCGVAVCAGETLLVGIAHDINSTLTASFGTVALTKAVSVLNTAGVEICLFHLLSADSLTSAIYFSFTANVTAKAMFAVRVCGVNTLDATRTATSNAVGVISSGSTAATPVSDMFLQALVGEEAPNSADAVSWLQDINNSGLVQSTSGGAAAANIAIHEGFHIQSVTGPRSAKLSSFTAADCAIALVTYKFVSAAAAALAFRKTLSEEGTRTGVRQVHAG